MTLEKRRVVVPPETRQGVVQSVLQARKIESRPTAPAGIFDPRLDLTRAEQAQIIQEAIQGESKLAVVSGSYYEDSAAVRFATFFIESLLQHEEVRTLVGVKLSSVDASMGGLYQRSIDDPGFTDSKWQMYLENAAFLRLITYPDDSASQVLPRNLTLGKLLEYANSRDDVNTYGPLLLLNKILHQSILVTTGVEKLAYMMDMVENNIELLRKATETRLTDSSFVVALSFLKSAAWTRLIVGDNKWKEKKLFEEKDWEMVRNLLDYIRAGEESRPLFLMLAFYATILGAEEAKVDHRTGRIGIILGELPELETASGEAGLPVLSEI